MNTILLYIVIFLANIVHGITGFAGTVLAMPFALLLVGYDTGKPILNVLGILSGFYVLVNNYKYVNWKEVKKIVIVMSVGLISVFFIKFLFIGKEEVLYKMLGIFVAYLGIRGLFAKKKAEEQPKKWVPNFLLVLAGIVHGLFISGGPLLIGYLTNIIKDKVVFRATISTVWIFLNTIILLDDIRLGLWNMELVRIQIIAIPFLFAGMFVGTKLYKRMKQETFMKVTYILLFISGVALLV